MLIFFAIFLDMCEICSTQDKCWSIHVYTPKNFDDVTCIISLSSISSFRSDIETTLRCESKIRYNWFYLSSQKASLLLTTQLLLSTLDLLSQRERKSTCQT